MTKLKGLYQIIDVFVTGVWGLTIIDLIIFVDLNNFKNLDNAIKILLAAAGLFYLVFIRIPNEYKMGKLNRREKKAEAENTELENKKLKNELNK